ncbi:Scd6-like Sm domain-containing protein [Pilobolus umbonatus]|nr:Scd6-like Sm domain-containing protein [Pilobolus umbonatus]
MDGVNYIGSKISLVSLNDIRYVGILHNVDSLQSTVALQNVMSYGTEGRKQRQEDEISASENLYDYVVFRGSDIKDLQVTEPPPIMKQFIAMQSSQYENMRMMSSNHYISPYHYNPGHTNTYWQSSQYQYPYMPYYTVAHTTMPTLKPDHQYTPLTDYSRSFNQPYSQIDETVITPDMKNHATEDSKAEEIKTESDDSVAESLAQPVTELKRQPDTESIHHKSLIEEIDDSVNKEEKTSEPTRPVLTKHTKTPITEPVHTKLPTTEPVNTKPPTKNTYMTAKKNTRQRNRISHEEFDYALSTAEFIKNHAINKTNDLISHIPDSEHFYNKNKSFFDDISCESTDTGREGKYHEERRLNMETFGQSNIGRDHRKRGGNRKSTRIYHGKK